MKDEVYNDFKKEISELHRKGFLITLPMWEEFEDEVTGKPFHRVEIAFFKPKEE